jgi:hypothetical protein
MSRNIRLGSLGIVDLLDLRLTTQTHHGGGNEMAQQERLVSFLPGILTIDVKAVISDGSTRHCE